jgi:hypothetical protein
MGSGRGEENYVSNTWPLQDQMREQQRQDEEERERREVRGSGDEALTVEG